MFQIFSHCYKLILFDDGVGGGDDDEKGADNDEVSDNYWSVEEERIPRAQYFRRSTENWIMSTELICYVASNSVVVSIPDKETGRRGFESHSEQKLRTRILLIL